MTKTTEIIVAATTEQPEEAKKANSFPFVFPNFFNFNFKLPQLPPFTFFHKGNDKAATMIPKQKQQEGVEDEVFPSSSKRSLVSFPNTQLVSVPPPLHAQPDPENYHPKTSNPFIIYQVYAIAGFILSKWIWGRWNERNNRGGRSPSDDRAEGRHSIDGPDNE